VLTLGIAVVAYVVIGIEVYGFQIAARGDPDQLQGGLIPLFLVIGLLAVAYGAIELWLSRS